MAPTRTSSGAVASYDVARDRAVRNGDRLRFDKETWAQMDRGRSGAADAARRGDTRLAPTTPITHAERLGFGRTRAGQLRSERDGLSGVRGGPGPDAGGCPALGGT